MALSIEKLRELSREYAQRALPASPRKKRPKGRKRSTKRKRAPQPDRYQRYLKSPHWLKFRDAILMARSYRCEEEGCENNRALHVHHLTYKRLGRERPEDVKVYCEFHHSLVDENHMKKSRYAFLKDRN